MFTRKMLKALGIEEEKIDQIMEAHVEVVDALKADRDTYKEDAQKLSAVQKELDELKAKGEDGYKEKYEKEHKAFEDFKTEQAAKETKAAKSKAYRELLREAGVSDKRFEGIIKLTDLDGIELDTDGKIKDADKHAETIKTEWADFIVSTSTRGAQTATPPTNNGGKTTMTRAEIMAIKDDDERQAKIAENLHLFGID